MKKPFILLLVACFSNLIPTCFGQSKPTELETIISESTVNRDFKHYFSNKTLRLDYIFSGDAQIQQISLDNMVTWQGWAGRQHHLNQLVLLGNGDIRVRDAISRQTIYRTSFSSLFQEWILTPEAKERSRAFENCFQIPMPLHTAEVEVTLRNAHQDTIAHLIHSVKPNDILIRQVDAQLNQKKIPYQYISLTPKQKEINNQKIIVSPTPFHQTNKAIDIAILAEGYTIEEMEQFKSDAKMAMQSILSHAPFSQYSDRFNFLVLCSPSKESGVSIPSKRIWKETAVSSHFDTFYSRRYLTTKRLRKMHDLLAGFPYEHIIVLANTDTYGGGGIYNSYTLTTAHHASFWPVVTHEFGHSFGGLADEYAYANADDESPYPSDREPWEQNITTLHDFSKKWEDMLPEKTPIPTTAPSKTSNKIHSTTQLGVYEGAGYQEKGAYRSTPNCRMRTNNADAFCPVCQRALTQIIHFYTEK